MADLVSILSDINPWLALATFPIRLLISLGFFCIWLFVMYQAHSGREYRIPFIGRLRPSRLAKPPPWPHEVVASVGSWEQSHEHENKEKERC